MILGNHHQVKLETSSWYGQMMLETNTVSTKGACFQINSHVSNLIIAFPSRFVSKSDNELEQIIWKNTKKHVLSIHVLENMMKN